MDGTGRITRGQISIAHSPAHASRSLHVGFGESCCFDSCVAARRNLAAFLVGARVIKGRASTHGAEPGQQLIQALIPFIEPRLHAGRDHGVSIRNGLEDGVRAYDGFAVVLFEVQRLKRNMAWSAFELEGQHEAIRGWRAEENTVKPVLVAIGVPVGEAPRTPIAGVEIINGHCQLARAEPLHEQFRIDVGAKEEISRRGKLPRDQDLMTPWFGDDLCLSHDAFLSLN